MQYKILKLMQFNKLLNFKIKIILKLMQFNKLLKCKFPVLKAAKINWIGFVGNAWWKRSREALTTVFFGFCQDADHLMFCKPSSFSPDLKIQDRWFKTTHMCTVIYFMSFILGFEWQIQSWLKITTTDVFCLNWESRGFWGRGRLFPYSFPSWKILFLQQFLVHPAQFNLWDSQ